MSEFRIVLYNETKGDERLDVEPFGLDDLSTKFIRNREWHGFEKDFSFDLEFHCQGGGKDYIDDVLLTQGIDAEILIDIDYKCNKDDDFSDLFEGTLDLTKIERTDFRTKVKIDRNDFSTIVKARRDTKVNLKSTSTIDGGTMSWSTYAPYTFTFHSQATVYNAELNDTSPHTTSFVGTTSGFVNNMFFSHPHPLVVNEFETSIDNPDSQNFGVAATLGTDYFHEGTQAEVSYPETYTVEWDFSGTIIDSVSLGYSRGANNVRLYFAYGANAGVAAKVQMGQVVASYSGSAAAIVIGSFNFSGSTTINMAANDKIWVFWEIDDWTQSTGSDQDVDFEVSYSGGANFKISAPTGLSSTTGDAIAIYEAGARLAEAITNQTDGAFKSDFLGRKNSNPDTYSANGCGAFVAITNGYNIRQFTERGIFTSLDEYYNSLDAIFNIGMGFEKDGDLWKIRIEEKSYFYDKTGVSVKFDNVRGVTITTDTSYAYNNIRLGFKKWQAEELGGLDEFCTDHEWLVPTKKVNNLYTQKSSYIAAGYLIEQQRRKNKLDFGTEDTSEDDDIFIIATSRSVDGSGNPDTLDESEKDAGYSSITGILNSDTRYNLWFSVKRCLLRHLNVISSSMTLDPGVDIQFRKGSGNIDLVSTKSSITCNGDYKGNSLTDNADIAWDETNARLNAPLWVPNVHEFESSLTFSDYNLILNNPYKLIQYSSPQGTFRGFLLEMGYNLIKQSVNIKILEAYES